MKRGAGGQSAGSLVDDQTANGEYTSTYLRPTQTARSYFSWNGVDYGVNGRAAAAPPLPTLIKICVPVDVSPDDIAELAAGDQTFRRD